MNKLVIVGNLVRDPETRVTQSGKNVCTFTVAVNRRHSTANNQQDADYFRVSAWEKLGDLCQQFLNKGRKVAVTGNVSVTAYKNSNGEAQASMNVYAEEVEFLTPKQEKQTEQNAPNAVVNTTQNKYVEVSDEELPF